jgi:hypothetical protein
MGAPITPCTIITGGITIARNVLLWSCTDRGVVFKDAFHNDWDAIAKLKAETMRAQMIARAMAIRAAVNKLREKPEPVEQPGAKPAIDYNRM